MEIQWNDADPRIIEMSKFLSTVKGESFDICAAIFKMILSSENPETMLSYFLFNGKNIKSSEAEDVAAYFTALQIQHLKRNCEGMVDGILNKLVCTNLTENEFYTKLWLCIQNDSMFAAEAEKIYALYSIYSDPRLPYFQLDSGLKMSNEQFASTTNDIFDDIKKAIFILNAKLEQRTEVASLLMQILKSYDSIEKQSVMLAQILTINRRNNTIAQSTLKK